MPQHARAKNLFLLTATFRNFLRISLFREKEEKIFKGQVSYFKRFIYVNKDLTITHKIFYMKVNQF